MVICLPYPHEGGQLRVAHQGLETIFDWGQKEANKIQWAAFYSDCEHEVLEVKSGHRITLTYNLYVRERLGGVMRQNTSVNLKQYALSNKFIDALKAPDFMTKGGVLGFYCQHAYAHTNDNHRNRLPYALKGIDAVFYSTFYHLGLDVEVRPVMKGMPDEDDRKLRKQLQGAELVGAKLHGVILSDVGGCEDEGSATMVCRLDNQPNMKMLTGGSDC